MMATLNFAAELSYNSSQTLPDEVINTQTPIILRNFISNWPLTEISQKSISDAVEYLLKFYNQQPVNIVIGESDTAQRIFYNEDFSGFNFKSLTTSMDNLLSRILQYASETKAPTLYMASTEIEKWLPGFNEDNNIVLDRDDVLASIWIGNKCRISAHFDLPSNIACCAAGRRTFTLFPPDQVSNLYPGPIDFAPGGQPISTVDFKKPDYKKFPRFKEALKNALVAELEPGDAVIVPSMWWHHVESFDDLNVLVNYWWRESPKYMGNPSAVLNHALMAMRQLPDDQKKAWKQMFDYYIFENDENSHSHIPDDALGILSPMDESIARKIRTMVLNQLNR
tara:strand:+ start:1394 stop:2407 length:1014 start_codon:yes stop_codon:yes gene_type:complete